ncbi:MAG: hypothetical protein R3335_15120 [Anaerolineales bacterium]|nr:hypothetical protein [Anaerolineales bacterium]
MEGESRAGTIPDAHWETLAVILETLRGQDLLWVVTGSVSLALQGVPVAPNDIDLQTTAEGAFLMERLFAPYMVRPVVYSAVERIRSQFGAFILNGIEVEIIGDIQKRRDDGGWTAAPDLEQLRIFVAANGRRIPILPLEYEAEAYAQLGKAERAEELLSWLAR